jgi:hypothetical protein
MTEVDSLPPTICCDEAGKAVVDEDDAVAAEFAFDGDRVCCF